MTGPLLVVRGVSKWFSQPVGTVGRLRGRKPRVVHALSDVDLNLERWETLGIVGESGCGKSTLARCIVRLFDPDAGSVVYDGTDVATMVGAERRRFHRRVQMIFQDPASALNPRMTVRQALAEPLRVHGLRQGRAVDDRVRELLDLVRLPLEVADRHPAALSGGQRQRIGIARALSVEPECLIADEVVSALDVSVQAQIVNLLLDLQERLRLAVLFISHDLRLVRHLSHRIAVMYLGRVVEMTDTERLFTIPAHPYTAALLAAAPSLDPEQRSRQAALSGELPSPLALPAGCAFHTRCPRAAADCRATRPALDPVGAGHLAACLHPLASALSASHPSFSSA